MEYLFRDITYEGQIIRFIKPHAFDSVESAINPLLNEMVVLKDHIQQEEPDVIVAVMAGSNNILIDNTQLMSEYSQAFPRKFDEFYTWKSAPFNS